jgi:hypothetical protein
VEYLKLLIEDFLEKYRCSKETAFDAQQQYCQTPAEMPGSLSFLRVSSALTSKHVLQ